MNDEQYLKHALQLLSEFAQTMVTRTEHLPQDDSLRELTAAFQSLANGEGDLYGDGISLVTRLFTTYPDFAPTLPRELLWFFGGDCLHYMPDDEIATFAQLAELRGAAATRGETLDLRAARAKLLNLQ
ncbi:MAG: dehydrogenase [Gammaproteobacteria bacterium]|nr:MAG: dehydrogenase [Gammaproteobacteria bacterium]